MKKGYMWDGPGDKAMYDRLVSFLDPTPHTVQGSRSAVTLERLVGRAYVPALHHFYCI